MEELSVTMEIKGRQTAEEWNIIGNHRVKDQKARHKAIFFARSEERLHSCCFLRARIPSH